LRRAKCLCGPVCERCQRTFGWAHQPGRKKVHAVQRQGLARSAKPCGPRRGIRFAGAADYSERVSSTTLTGFFTPWCSIRLRLV
jgi:hypothetical protein